MALKKGQKGSCFLLVKTDPKKLGQLIMLAAAASEWLNAMTSKKLAYFFDKLRDYLKKSNCDLQVKMNRDSV